MYLLLTACRNLNEQKLSVKAINDSVITLTNHYLDTNKFSQAIGLLERAIEIDSNDYETYTKKLFFETALGNFKSASQTSSKLIKFKPDSADLHFQRGLFKELINDTLSSKFDFSKAVLLYKSTLDTMNKRHPYWLTNWKNSAMCLIMVGQENIIHDFLKQNCASAFDSSFYDVEILTKGKNELLQSLKSKYIR